ncbi:hypothetical protein LCGC14_0862120 [marine sediment metagenome]|uniref:Uncharacterized protein n=1 Tax=marine sediment metagenome TaxID=412755 RepID=A0A0F9RRR2_9ZZZZ
MSGSILDKRWLTLHKVEVEDICVSIADLNAGENRPVHIGTDAQKHGKFLDFVTAVVVLDPGKGGRVFYCKTREKHINSLQHKLFTEVGLSLEIAQALCEHIDADQIQVHVDANTNLKWDSGKYHQQLAGMVVGSGFKAVLKPDAWAASHVADHAVNGKNESSSTRRRNKKASKRAGKAGKKRSKK